MRKITLKQWMTRATAFGVAMTLSGSALASGPAACGPIKKAPAERATSKIVQVSATEVEPIPSLATPKVVVEQVLFGQPAPANAADPATPVVNTVPAAPYPGEAVVAPPAAETYYAAPVESYQSCDSGCCDSVYEPVACDEVIDSCDGCAPTGCGMTGFGCELGDPWKVSSLFAHGDSCDGPVEPCIDFGGWTSFGYHSRSTGLFNDRPDEFNWHQVWLYAEKVADGSDGVGFGGRVDFMYGQDAGDTQAFGNNDGQFDYVNGWDRGAGYGFAMPQLYAEVASGDLSVIAGHFYTLLGYEVVTAPDNFFYSHAYTMYNSEAFTHTGALATYSASDNLTLYGGWTLGWDTGFDQFDQNGQNGSSFLGGYSVGVGDNASLTHIITAGDLGAIGDGWSQSLVFDVSVTDDLNYVFQSDILDVENTETVGINQYLLYSLTDCLGIGTRMEWWKADSDSVYAWTGGFNIRPHENIVLRPEMRYQWDPGANNGVITQESENAFTFGVDCVVTF